MEKKVVWQAVISILGYLSVKEKRYALFMVFLLIIASVLDVFGLASLVPIIMASSSPDLIFSNKYMAYLFNFLHFQNKETFLLFLIVCVFVFFLLKNLFVVFINQKQVKFTAAIALTVVDRQFSKYTNVPFFHFNKEGSAKLINNIFNIPAYYVINIIRPVFIFLSEVVIIAVIVFGIFIYQPVLFLILIAVLAPSALFTYSLLKKKSETIGKTLNKLRPVSYSILNNTFNGFVELKLANKLNVFRKKFLINQKETQSAEALSYLFSQIPLKVIEMVAILGIVTIFLFSLFSSDGLKNLVTIIGLFAAAAYRLMPSLNRLLMSVLTIKQNTYIFQELDAFKNFESLNTNKDSAEAISFQSSIKFADVTFSFPDEKQPVISKLNLNIIKGEKVGIIGASGSGKTTIVNLLLRFYNEQEGAILIDGKQLNSKNKLSWHELVGYVKQDTFLMDASIRDNITLMEDAPDEARLKYTIEMASLAGFIKSLPNGSDTILGEKGSRLSGGQKQRIGIARALYKKASVLIFDEATSALDNNTEIEISESISKLSETDITIIIIAHRITTLKHCNRIIELKDGKIIAEKSYKEVVSNLFKTDHSK